MKSANFFSANGTRRKSIIGTRNTPLSRCQRSPRISPVVAEWALMVIGCLFITGWIWFGLALAALGSY